jgi:hypothetical protein
MRQVLAYIKIPKENKMKYTSEASMMSWNLEQHKEQIVQQLNEGTRLMIVAHNTSRGTFEFYARWYCTIKNEYYMWVSNDERRRILKEINNVKKP